jgi:SnoaL-like domain
VLQTLWSAPMTVHLPPVLDRYFAAQNAHDIEAMVACFAPNAAVRDEGRDIVGTQAVRAWKMETSDKYHIAAEPIACRREDDYTVVTVKVSGNFPGSPANLSYRFGLSVDGLIGTLEVR